MIQIISSRPREKLHLRHEEFPSIFFKSILNTLRRYWVKFTRERVLKCKYAPFNKLKCVRELSLQPQEISKVHQGLVMIKILLQEPHHILDGHGALNLVKLMLQRLILRTLLEGHNFGSIIHSAHHIHRQEFSGRSRPILVGLNEKEFLGGPGFLLVVDPRLHFLHSLLLSFRRAFHLGFYLVVDRVPIVSLIFFIKAKSSKLIG